MVGGNSAFDDFPVGVALIDPAFEGFAVKERDPVGRKSKGGARNKEEENELHWTIVLQIRFDSSCPLLEVGAGFLAEGGD